MDKKPVIQIQDNQKGYLALPFDQEQFQQFVKGLLGKPQTINKRIRGNFEIHLKDLQNFHDLINQRISQQNAGKLIQLKTKIYYSDDSSVLLSSYEELVSYNEVKPVVSEAVRMSWSYLIKFQEKDVPEKQEIELMIISTPYSNVVEYDDLPVIFSRSGEIRIAIQHTARSWGSDIESLLTNQINSILIKEEKVTNFFKKNSIKIGLLIGSLFLISSFIGIYFASKRFNLEQVKRVNTFIKQPKIDISQKTDFLLNYIAANEQAYLSNYIFIYFLVSLVLAILLGTWVESMADNKQHSFVILTREAKTESDNIKKMRERKTMWFCISIVVSVLTGIAANYVFTWLTK